MGPSSSQIDEILLNFLTQGIGTGNVTVHGYSYSDISQPISGLTLPTSAFIQGFTLVHFLLSFDILTSLFFFSLSLFLNLFYN